MNRFFLILIGLLLLNTFTWGQTASNYKPVFTFGDSATIIIDVKNCKINPLVHFSAQYIYPLWSKGAFEFTVKNDVTKSFRILAEHPVKFYVSFSFMYEKKFNNFHLNGLVLPGDTLSVQIDYASVKNPDVVFKGKSAIYSEYYYQLGKQPNFQIIIGKTMFPARKYAAGEMLEIDSCSMVQRAFLNKYLKTHTLPDWFVTYERLNIIYSNAEKKLALIRSNNTFDSQKIYLKPNFISQLKGAKIDNPEAIHIPAYYNYLSLYFDLLKYPVKTSNVNSLKLTSFINTLPDIERELKSEVRDYYYGKRLSEYYTDLSAYERIDSIQSSLQSKFINQQVFTYFLEHKKKASTYISRIAEYKARKIGDRAPIIQMVDTSGIKFNYDKLSNKFVIIHFWSSLTPSYVQTVDSINALFAKLDNSRTCLLHICADQFSDKWKGAIRKTSGNATHLFAKGNWNKSLFEEYGITGLPFFAILDDLGIIVFRKSNSLSETWNAYLKIISQPKSKPYENITFVPKDNIPLNIF